MFKKRSSIFLPCLGVITAAVTACTDPVAEALCQKGIECREEPADDSDNGEDDVAVCMEGVEWGMDSARANAEPECSDLADAYSAMNSCIGQLECADYNAPDRNNKCSSEKQAVCDVCQVLQDGEIDCETILAFSCGGCAPAPTPSAPSEPDTETAQ